MSTDTEYLGDVWWSRDFPVLKEAVLDLDAGKGRHECDAIAARAGVTGGDARSSFLALERQGLISLHKAGSKPIFVRDVSGRAYDLTGAHPSPEAATDRLIAALEARVANATPEERPKLQSLLAILGGMSRDVLVRLVGDALGGLLP